MISSSLLAIGASLLAAAGHGASAFPVDMESQLTTRATNASAGAGPYGLNNEVCHSVTLQAHANSSNIQFINVDDNYNNQSYITSQILEYTTGMTNWTTAHMSKTMVPFNDTFQIKGHYCTPKQGAKTNSSLIVAVHGVGFDSSYWDFSYAPSYSFVKHAASYGYSSFIYDRIGCGDSEAPANGGFSVVQAPTEVSILQNILTQLRTTSVVGNQKHTKITLMGHSYGSAQSQALSANYPDLIEGLVLTGFSTNSTGNPPFYLAGTFAVANTIPTLPQLKSRPDIWLGTSSAVSDVEQFIDAPYYEQGAADIGRATAQPVTLGTLFSISAISKTATTYNKPVFVQDGARDLPFCDRNCYAPAPSAANQALAVKSLFPAASNFSTSIIPQTGHGIVLHPTSGEASEQIMSFIISNNL